MTKEQINYFFCDYYRKYSHAHDQASLGVYLNLIDDPKIKNDLCLTNLSSSEILNAIYNQMKETDMIKYAEQKAAESEIHLNKFVDLVKNSKDEKYIEECLNNPYLKLPPEHKIELINSLNNPEISKQYADSPEFKKYFIKSTNERINNLKEDEYIKLLISTKSSAELKYFFDNYKFSDQGKAKIIPRIFDTNQIKEILKNNSNSLRNNDLAIMVAESKNPELIKTYLENKSLNSDTLFYYIKNDNDFIKNVIETTGKELSPNDYISLLSKITDANYITNLIDNNQINKELEIILISRAINNGTKFEPEYVKKVLNDNLKDNKTTNIPNTIVPLIVATKDENYKKTYIENSNLDSQYKIRILKTIDDPEYIKQIIEDEKIEISYDDRIQLIKKTADEQYIFKKLNDPTIKIEDKIDLYN